MLRRCVLPLLVLSTPMALAAASKGKGDGLSQKEIVDVIQSHSDDARACYKAAEDKNKDSAGDGKVKIRFLIGLAGKIEVSEIEHNTFKDKTIGNCLRDKMKTWAFPKPRGQQRVSIAYPFEFKSAPAPVAPAAPAAPAAPGEVPVPPAPPVPATPETPPSPPEPMENPSK